MSYFHFTTTVVGHGRMGRALSAALPASGPHGRGCDGEGAEVVLLAVPDGEIAAAAAAIAPGRAVGHLSGATTLAPLAGHADAFSLHPLMTVTGAETSFAGAACAVAGTTPRALEVAHGLAGALGMRPFEVPDADRAAYHASASVASNFLLTLEWAAERLLPAGVDRTVLAPLVRATVDNWERLGPEAALTGPVARGDEETVARQRAAVADRAPDLVVLFDALTDHTRALAGVPA